MNDILRNLINEDSIAFFIDDVLVMIDLEVGHNKVMVEILKKMEANNLYMKPEKYMWKQREVSFLGINMGLEELNIEKEKVKGVLKWPRL